MEIPSLPVLGANVPAFWNGLFRFCRRCGATHLTLNSYASIEAAVPAVPRPARHTDRIEYLIDLGKVDLWQSVHQNHRRRINRARKAGVRLRSCTSEESCRIHCQMIGESMGRRERRGEQVSTRITPEDYLLLLRSGVGVLFQAVIDDRVLSSILVLLSSRGGYYHSAGTSPEGMEHGASHFLVFETANALLVRGAEVFNLGGASGSQPGLQDFKARFGTVQRDLTAAEFDLRTRWHQALEGAVRGFRGRLSRAVGF